ncbi:Hsp20/alpha crystallin family protein [Luteimonas sp. MC1782]|uniref:Hsp20/alpha crystallin family protein n=1 Tax=Luteimonas sp. MC1782 TaxID=2760305 RepID=UPI001601D30E|nr:Hsp20/alpha crystallin family protein [Luteimonas sp. MC1782]MBB1473324.1 Hsp20/alpha crystallin family protein [Luteimonas sp. MC1782]
MNQISRQRDQWPRAQDPMGQLFDRLFGGNLMGETGNDESSVVTSQWAPRVDIKEEHDRFVLYADIPGVDPKDIEIQMDKGLLTLKGERSSVTREEGEQFSRIERSHGIFHRRFALPDSADPDRISASGEHGVLEIVIPKRPETTPRRIQVGARTTTQQNGG